VNADSIIRRGILLLVIASASFANTARAQWSNDPAANLIVADINGGATQPKIAPTSDGGFYISWLDRGFGYDVRLQRLDADGRELWAHNGVLIADRNDPLLIDYGICTDSDDNAYLAFECCTYGAASEHVTLAKVTPDGSLAWGPFGVLASPSNQGALNAACALASDGNILVAWSSNSGVRAQKVDPAGSLLWTATGALASQLTGISLLADVEPGLNGDAIVSWNNISGNTRILFAQKLASADGSRMWNGGMPDRIFGAGNLETYFYKFDVDGVGGGVFWDYDLVGSYDVPRVQHLDVDGNPLLGVDGVVATTDNTIDHTNTSAWFDAATGDIYAVWRDSRTDGAGMSEGVSAQLIDSTGALQWGDTGKVLVPLTSSSEGISYISQPIALPAPNGFIASWVVGAAPAPDQVLQATYLDHDGNAVWPTAIVDAKTIRYTTHAVGAVSASGYFAYAWTDGDETLGTSTIRAQDINLDGTLGSPPVEDAIFLDGFDGV
jgi:hypothetical protein